MSIKMNLFLDLGILTAFLVAFEPQWTGIAIHEWLSLAFAGTLVAHVLLHWKWIVNVAARFLRQWFHSSRLNFVVDALIFGAFTSVMLSGVLISKSILPLLGLESVRDPVWRVLHARSADATLILTALHFALHWKWVLHALARYVGAPIKTLAARALGARQPTHAEA